ncbi:MAG TPA: WYL domain-containing protein [Sphaerochaeta sp.]|nr:WYL domain-containing protein [Sphaerochaeta sp.]
MSQLERILYINRSIERVGGVRTADVREHFEISRRQVLRDIAYLRDRLDAPIFYERSRAWYTYSEPFTLFFQSNERLLVLGAVFRSLVSSHGLDSIITDEASEVLSQQVEEQYRSLEEKIIFHTPVQDWPDWQIFSHLLEAMQRSLRLSLSYRDSAGALSRRHIEALRLINYSGRWYLLAWDLQKHTTRTFHLARVVRLQAIEGDYAKERFTAAELDAIVGSGYGIFIGGEIQEVSFVATEWAAEVIATQVWHPKQHQERRSDGSLVMRLPVANPNELISVLLSYGEHIEVLSPSSFVTAYTARIEAMAEKALV